MKLTKNRYGHVLITGASTGIGRACALRLARLGYDVWAGVRRETDGAALGKEAGGKLHPAHLDVTDISSISSAVEMIAQAAGEEGLRAVVNNAGIGVVGPIEFITLDQWRRQFEVNLFGQIAVTQAALPLLRRHVAAHGTGAARIVMMSSIGGRIAQPVLGPYTASKFALEAVSDSLRLELAGQGIQICVVEPGAIDTPIWKKGEESASALPPDHPAWQLYGRMIAAVAAAAQQAAREAVPASCVAEAVEKCLSQPRPRTRYLVGRRARLATRLKQWLPDRWFDAVIRRTMGIN